MNVGELRDLYEYNDWATSLVLDAVTALTPEEIGRNLGSSFPSIRETLVHIMSAEWVWLSRWKGTSPREMPKVWETLDLSGIRDAWRVLRQEQMEFILSLSEAQFDEPLAYRNTAGEPFVAPLGQLLRHVVNHSTYHRGQIATMMRQLGHQSPSTDLVVYHRTLATR